MHTVLLSCRCAVIALALQALFAGPGQASVTYDAATEFSLAANPNGPWRYGWRGTAVSSDFTLYTLSGTFGGGAGIDCWYTWDYQNGLPNVGHNPTDQTNGLWAPNQLALHPEIRHYVHHPNPIPPAFSLVRWTAPSNGVYALAAAFSGLSLAPTADVHVVLNGASLFDGMINGNGDTSSYTATLSLSLGDTLDFVVGDGGTQPIWDLGDEDYVALSVSVTVIPPGDVNADGDVDVLDLLYLVDAFGTRAGSANWNPVCDLNGDTVVDSLDRQIFLEAYGATQGQPNYNPACDFNGDGAIDSLDSHILLVAYGAYAPDPAYNPTCDFNGDGSVDVVDLLILVENFGKY